MTAELGDPMDERDELFQVSILQALSLGNYHGSISVDEFKTHGDIGLGTFDRLNGEMIMIDGTVYRADGDGEITEVTNDTIPFGNAAFIEGGEEVAISADSIDTLRAELNECIKKNGINHMYAIRMNGLYDRIKVRSIRAQEKPYLPLVLVLTEQQKAWEHRSVKRNDSGLPSPFVYG